MNVILIVSNSALWIVLLSVGFLLLGTLRSLGLMQWRLDELEATRPVRKGREGLPPGKQAPDFTLPNAAGGEVALHEFTGRKVLLVFTQTGCGPCHDVMPELNRLQEKGEQQVLVVNNGDPDETRAWADEVNARFPVLAQENWTLSKRYKVFATPFAFLIDEQGVVTSRGVAGSRQYLGYVLSGAGNRGKTHHEQSERDSIVGSAHSTSVSSREVVHA